MITYELRCDKDHRFEGWFANSEAFQQQMEQGLVRCPVCDSTEIEKRPSAVAIHMGRSAREPSRATQMAAAPAEGFFQKLQEFVEQNFEDVGAKFAEEARKMQTGEADSRSIRGTTTEAEEEALREEGIDFLKIALPKYDA